MAPFEETCTSKDANDFEENVVYFCWGLCGHGRNTLLDLGPFAPNQCELGPRMSCRPLYMDPQGNLLCRSLRYIDAQGRLPCRSLERLTPISGVHGSAGKPSMPICEVPVHRCSGEPSTCMPAARAFNPQSLGTWILREAFNASPVKRNPCFLLKRWNP